MAEKPVITQAMIDLYDEFTHTTLDRRGFMDELTKLAGGAAAAAAAVPFLANNYAKAQIVQADDARLTIEEVTFPSANGDVKGYLARPADASGPLSAVVVVHENRGLNPHIEDVTRRMALEGFLALGVDFLSPLGGTPENEDAARDLFQQLTPEQVVATGTAAIDYLQTHASSNGNVGAIGFCWGGGTVNRLAVSDPDLKAAVPYYGAQPDAADVPKIQARVMAHYGAMDERINAGIAAFEQALKAAGTDYQIFIYDGAQHAFNNDTNEARYNQAAAEEAWGRTVAFLKETLGGAA